MCLDKNWVFCYKGRKKERDCGEQLLTSITISKNQNSNNKFDVETMAKALMSVTGHKAVASIYGL